MKYACVALHCSMRVRRIPPSGDNLYEVTTCTKCICTLTRAPNLPPGFAVFHPVCCVMPRSRHDTPQDIASPPKCRAGGQQISRRSFVASLTLVQVVPDQPDHRPNPSSNASPLGVSRLAWAVARIPNLLWW